jgi:hypothetical protein
MDGAARDAEGEGFVVLAPGDSHQSAGMEVQAIEKFEELAVFFVHANDFGGFTGVEIGEQDGSLFAELGEAAAEGNAVGAGFFARETFEEEGFDFGRDGVLETLGFVVSLGPGEADDVGEEHFRELVPEGEASGDATAFASEVNTAIAGYADQIVAAHAFDGGGYGGRGDAKLLGQAGADGLVPFLDKFPDGFEVVFLGDAGFVALQVVSARKVGRRARGL